MSAWIAFSLLIFIAIAHSILGQKFIIGPLSRDSGWQTRLPRPYAVRTLKFAWHLTTVAWVGLAAIVVGAPVGVTFGLVCLASALVIFVMLRGHLAWPLFLAAGLYGLDVSDALPRSALLVLVGIAVGIASAGALLHLAWVFGASWGFEHATPEDPETSLPVAEPGRVMTLAAAGASATLAGLLWWVTWGSAPSWTWWFVAAAAFVLVVRVIGDGKDVGLTKVVRSTRFASLDDALFTPLFVALAFGAVATLHLTGLP